MTYVAGFGGSMGVHARGLGLGASRAEGRHHSVGEGTVPEVELACMFAELKTRQGVPFVWNRKLSTYVASGPSAVMRT